MSRYIRRKVSLIIPCYWYSAELEFMTVRCLKSVHDLDNKIEKILVNDGSPSMGKISDLHVLYSDLINKRIDRPVNGGYSAAVNSGLEIAEGDIIIVGNNDLEFPRKWLPELLCVLEDGYDLATCWTSDQDYVRRPEITEGGKFGSIFAMKRQILDTIGGFDEELSYFADDDYRKRLTDAGFKIGFNRSLVINHQAKATYSKVDPDDSIYQRCKLIYQAKHGEYIE